MIKFLGKFKRNKRVFLDYASTTPTLPQIMKAMKPYGGVLFANPSAIYFEGITAKKALENTRREVAEILGCRGEEIIFTGSGTESDNLAILGIVGSYKKKFVPHIVTTNIEHPAVMEAFKEAERRGVEVTYVPVSDSGIVSVEDILKAVNERTVLVSVMLANNEIGTIQPVADIARAIKKRREELGTVLPYLHTDASQAANYISINVNSLGADMMTLDGGKIYGPKGVGALFVKRGIDLLPITFGGGQERGLRSGTENVGGVIGFAQALKIANKDREEESLRLIKLRDYFIERALKISPKVSLNGDDQKRLPNNVNICLEGVDSEFAVIQMDTHGVSCSAGSSCGSLSDTSGSYVISALGKRGCEYSSLRFTLGRHTSKKDIDKALKVLLKIIAK